MKKIAALVKFTQAHKSIAYNDELKNKFKNLGRAALKELLANLGPVHSSEISYNPAGIASSGDCYLKVMFNATQGVDLFFNLDGFGSYVTYRGIKNLKDYTGLQNNHIPFTKLLDFPDLQSRLLNVSAKVGA